MIRLQVSSKSQGHDKVRKRQSIHGRAEVCMEDESEELREGRGEDREGSDERGWYVTSSSSFKTLAPAESKWRTHALSILAVLMLVVLVYGLLRSNE